MKPFYLLSIVLLTTLITQCKSTKFDKTPPFTITRATYHYWVGGMPGVSGVNVFIGYQTDKNITFDSIYFANKKVKAQTKLVKGKTYLIGYFNTSTINSKEDLILHRNGKKEFGNKPPVKEKFPFKLKENEAVISFREKGKTKYYKVKNLQQTKTDFYP